MLTHRCNELLAEGSASQAEPLSPLRGSLYPPLVHAARDAKSGVATSQLVSKLNIEQADFSPDPGTPLNSHPPSH